ncbi:hypothetical protein GINT2_000549 [Glugoides intestinalis]
MTGAMFKDELFLCKKNSKNEFVVDDFTVSSDENFMKLTSFISNFKASEGLDFIVISLPVYFLIIRKKEKKVGIFATTTASYVEVFATLQEFFGELDEVITSYNQYLEIGYFTKREISTDEKDIVIDIDNKDQTEENADNYQVSNEEFDKILLEKGRTAKSIKLGKKKDECIEFKRYLFYLPTTEELQKFMFAISASSFDYVEILGTTKIAGVRKKGKMVWFSEIPSMEGLEGDYIEEVNMLMLPFLIGEL